MKALLLALLLSLASGPALYAADGGDAWPIGEGLSDTHGSQVYALASSAVTVTSSSVDLASVTGIYLFSTGTAQTGVVVQWSMDNTSWSTGVTLPHRNWGLKKHGRYVRFKGTGPVGGTITVRYATATAPSAGTVTVPTPTPGIQPVSSTATTAAKYEASATYTTHTTTTINITSTAGTDGRYNVTLRAVRGGTSLIYAINASTTPQATVATLDGREVITAASHKTEGPCYESGSHAHIRASGTASVVGTLILEQCK